MQLSSSLLERLERTKNLYHEGRYETAAVQFAAIASQAYPTAMDVWVDASFCLGECQRMLGAWEEALRSHCRVVKSSPRVANLGRLEQSNREHVVISLQSVINICRMSLWVETEALLELISDGHAWAASIIDAGTARLVFDCERALLARNTEGPIGAAHRFRDLLTSATKNPEHATLADTTTLHYRLVEVEFDGGRIVDLPRRPNREHFAWVWCTSMWRLLEGRRMLATGVDPSEIRSWLARHSFSDEHMRAAADIDLAQRWLYCVATDPREQVGAFIEWHESISRRDTAGWIVNRSNTSWHRLLFIDEARRRAASNRTILGMAQTSLERARQTFALPQVEAVVRSRGLALADLEHLRRTPLLHLQSAVLERLMRVVRP